MMGLDGLSNLIEGGTMEDTPDIPRDELTKEELEAREAEDPQQEVATPDDDDLTENGDEPAPVDDPDLPDDGDPEVDGLEPEPIPPGDFEDPESETSDTGEVREDPADLSEIQKEFDD
jgi:hypothetical protein